MKSNDRPLVAGLPKMDRTSLPLAGGKGANLGELIRAGFDVPPGFVITTAAYDLAVRDSGLAIRMDELLGRLGTGESSAVREASHRIREALTANPVPEPVSAVIIHAYRGLGGGAVAVRSSATAEDLPGAAFAGQQETFLNVIDEQAVLEAVRACWASLWSERAMLYRVHRGVDQGAVKLAVVVQRMVPADMAGVMFTADPASGARDVLIIDAGAGLGEAVVAGMVTPDHFVMDKRRVRIREHRQGRGEVRIRAKPGGGTERVAGDSQPMTDTLSPPALQKLARLGVRIERHYGAPQDVEWAWVADGSRSGRFLILQARPMTALPQPLKVTGPMRKVVPMLAEMWPSRPYPLDATTFTAVLERAVGGLLVALLGKSAPDPGKAMVEEDGVVVRFQAPEFHPSPGMFIAPWLTLWRTRRYDPTKGEADPIVEEVQARAGELESLDRRALSWEQNLEAMQRALSLIPRVMELRERYFPRALAGLGRLWLLLALTRHRDRLGALMSGIETKTTETNLALEALAARIRNDPALRDLFAGHEARKMAAALELSPAGRDFLQAFAVFLERYGHRETALTISKGAWKDQPATVLGLLKVLAAAEPRATDSYQAWKRVRDELLETSALGRWPFRRSFVKALTYGRSLLQMREDTHFYGTLALSPVRRAALELGRRLQMAGALSRQEDVYYLRREELEALGEPWPPPQPVIADIRATVARRTARFDELASKPLFDPRLLAGASRAPADADILLSGSPGSPGVATGPARIVHGEEDFGKLKPGDVLVAPLTNPAWTPLFRHAAAVVVDAGGAGSHAAIVAREYGVPAVIGTVNGTSRLADGQRVRVDGTRGLVMKPRDEE